MHDVLRVAIRWLHDLAGVAWVGGSLFFLLVLEPALSALDALSERQKLQSPIGRAFADVVDVAMVFFLVTGVVLLVDQLAQPGITFVYEVVLVAHVVLGGAMCGLALLLRSYQRSRRFWATWPKWATPPYMLLALGLLAYLTADLLRILFDEILRTVS